MTARDIFEAFVRGFGLVLVVNALLAFATSLPVRSDFSTGAFWARVLALLVIGLFLMLRGDRIVEVVYRNRNGRD